MLKQVLMSRFSLRRLGILHRTFLSDAYSCREAWQARLTTPVLAQVNHDSLYYELEQKLHQKAKVSAIDIDIYANKMVDDSHIEEVADLMHKFRLTEETSNTLDSTHHAIVRNYVEHSHYSELIELLNNRLGYGVFLDDFTSNLTLDRLITTNEFKWAARIVTLLGLQEDFTNPITRSLALYACYRYVKSGEIDHFDDLIPPPPQEPTEGKKKKKDEIKVRVNFIRNEFFDDHFDIKDTKLLLGKTFFLLGLNSEGAVGNSSKLLGLVLYEKYSKAVEFVQTSAGTEINEEVLGLVKTFLGKHEHKDDEHYVKLVDLLGTANFGMKVDGGSFEKLLIDGINRSVEDNEERQIEEQKSIYIQWCELRQHRLEEELARLQRAKRIQEMEKMSREMEQEEQKLWFFENEDKLDLQIDSKKVFYPKRWFGKKKKPRVVDEGYIPPEVRQRQGQQ
ncbi:uncharacterized protein LOC131689823 [Topomyia yanbarensis]|uniref:uncharacterized protein LOC131689823 n=1 Tax=Topomyia yanbarensis TaxID=2498891 RepID=UPI00273AF437|nr:uncharacterized protein LOC131689823 [Topomyia yanbarensis]